ncbi:MAG: tetratricopeptide repeat protein [Terracidiphilus sp.]
MNSRSCRWLIFSALIITASGACKAPPASDQKSITTLERQATSGDAEAQYNLGILYNKGEGMPQDYTQAAVWYRKAAEQGLAPAQIALGASYEQGQGVPQDYAEAYFWYDLAASGKTSSAKEDAKFLRDGIASHLTPADLSREQEWARQWFKAHQSKPQ